MVLIRFTSGYFKGQEALTARPGEYLEPVDFEKVRELLEEEQQGPVTEQDIISYVLYQRYMNNIFKLEINTETYRYLIRLHSSLECVMVKQ